uniref:Uncharacterized protein n=1 Tax=Arundo donax TaxID=35708 RepID=A0A0A8ZNM7_ARUDO
MFDHSTFQAFTVHCDITVPCKIVRKWSIEGIYVTEICSAFQCSL